MEACAFAVGGAHGDELVLEDGGQRVKELVEAQHDRLLPHAIHLLYTLNRAYVHMHETYLRPGTSVPPLNVNNY